MKKINKQVADRYFYEKNLYMGIFFGIWFLVSYGSVLSAESLSKVTFIGFPLHYFMGAIGALATFIMLLFANAIIGDRIDKRYGINHETNERIAADRTLDH